ncbi:glycosyltransferase family 2 protein [Pseudomonas sp. dw_358]|uniref:glycosyltransferase family 2 protein n=1 Tax=Pseudomonas sp. dw_358 TaxID=2720083 RepID=UPI001BD47CDE|nr:glycosyltransferase family 2 protein [Pseudomonas sp. dw_358]
MNAAQPKVSVVIPTKNGGRLFREVMASLMAQETDWPFEVIVVDSGSRDDTAQVARSFAGVKVMTIDPAEFQHGRTRNLAIQQTSGEYIALITQDALPVGRYWLSELVKAIEQDDQIAGVFGRHLAYQEAPVFTHQELEQHFSGFQAQPVVQLLDRERYSRDPGYRQLLYFFSDNNAVIRRSVWEKHPYPEVDFSEDQAWARRIIEAGFKKAYCHDAVVYHSHTYGLWERFQRSFDESMALEGLFHYGQAKGPVVLLRRWVGLTLRDVQTVRRHLFRLGWRGVADAVKMPLDNFMRVLGGWLGAREDLHTPRLVAFCSLDKKLKRVKNAS